MISNGKKVINYKHVDLLEYSGCFSIYGYLKSFKVLDFRL